MCTIFRIGVQKLFYLFYLSLLAAYRLPIDPDVMVLAEAWEDRKVQKK